MPTLGGEDADHGQSVGPTGGHPRPCRLYRVSLTGGRVDPNKPRHYSRTGREEAGGA